MPMKKLSLLVTLAMAFASGVAAQTTIGAPGGAEVRTWGVGNTPIYGQTITTPTDNLLDQFSFWLGRTSPLSSTPTPSIDFKAYVYGWSDAMGKATGSALYTSALVNHSTTTSGAFSRYDFNVGGLSLVSGQKYVLFIETVGGSGGIFVESTTGNEYAGGDFWFNNSGDPGTTWSGPGFPTATDLKFEAKFSPVPEPSTGLLLLTGLLGIGIVGRNRRREESELS